jgi:hypothetical protein
MSRKEKPLTADEVKRNAALDALIQSDSVTAAAETAGISRKTLYNYLNNDKDFILAYRNMKREQLRETAGKVKAAADKATDFITGLLDDKEAPYPVRLNAALKVLDLAGTYRDIEAQIAENTLKDMAGVLDFSRESAV